MMQINDVNVEGRTMMHVACQFNKPDVGCDPLLTHRWFTCC